MRPTDCEVWMKEDTSSKERQRLHESSVGTDREQLPYAFRSVRIL